MSASYSCGECGHTAQSQLICHGQLMTSAPAANASGTARVTATDATKAARSLLRRGKS